MTIPEVLGVEAVDEVVQADRPTSLHARDEVDHPKRRERITGLGHDRRADGRIGHSGRRGPKVQRAWRGGLIDHDGRHVFPMNSDLRTRNCA
jgi:hypothetical protein